jgi:hypothetical protein
MPTAFESIAEPAKVKLERGGERGSSFGRAGVVFGGEPNFKDALRLFGSTGHRILRG